MKTTITIMVTLLIVATHFSFAQSTEPDGRVYSVRPLTLKKDVNAEEFEKYAKNELETAYRNVPGVEARVARSDRGADKGIYLLVYFFDSTKLVIVCCNYLKKCGVGECVMPKGLK